MSLKSGIGRTLTARLAPRLTDLAPGITHTVVREALNRAIDGVGPLPSAVHAAEAQLSEQRGNRDKAVGEVVENHVAYAGAQGFVTNLGGLVTMALTIPVNISGLALVQCRMVAGIAHLRGYDVDDARVRNAILASLLGKDTINQLVGNKVLPAPPMALATAPMHDPSLDTIITNEVARELITRIGGKQLITTAGRRVPILGGVVGAGADALSTWQIGRYAGKELRPRTLR